MKKNNKNGFAITELLAVTVVIMVIFTTIYSNFLPTTAEYERRITYNDVSSQYAAHYIRKLYMDYDFENIITNTNHYVTLYTTSTGCSYLSGTEKTECNKIAKSLGIKEVIATKKNLVKLKDKSYKGTELSKYISYLPKYSNSSTTLEEYRLIVKTKTGYANTELKVFKPAEANKPTLTENLLPVYYNNGSWKVVDEDSKDWYDYNEGEWANAVTIVESARNKYFNEGEIIATSETEVPLADIDTMWVWIPRYKYTVFNYNLNGTTETSIGQIEVEFETIENDIPTSTGTVKCKDSFNETNLTSEICWDTENGGSSSSNGSGIGANSTYTHPAFTFGGVELAGIWVGKFENSLSSDGNIIIKPNEPSLIEKNEGFNNQINYIMKMNDTSNVYGLSSNADTHMIKNMEWGAVAYLTYSQYGIGNTTKPIIENFGITKNQSNPAYTGMSTCSTPSDYTTCRTYNQSTTSSTNKNITGIYDMVGGADEYVLGVNDKFNDRASALGGPTLANKYYDEYITLSQTDSEIAGAKMGKLGDATKEIYGIKADNQFVYDYQELYVLLRRGGYSTESTTIFLYRSTGDKDWNGKMGSRSVLVIDPNGGAL